MTTSRFYVPTRDLKAERLSLEGSEHHHASRVLRMRVGEEVVLLDGRGLTARGTIIDISSTRTIIAVENTAEMEEELPRLHLFQSLPAGTRMDIVVQLGTELGAATIMPFTSARASISHGQLNKRVDRWRKIALETSRVSGRPFLPDIGDVAGWEDMLKGLGLNVVSLFADEEGGVRVSEALGDECPGDISLVVGPEGGFTGLEREALKSRGAIPVTLGYNVLRTETAGAVLLAAVRCHYGLL